MMISVRPGGGQPGRPGDEARSRRIPRPHLSERRRPRAIQLQEVSILPEWYCTGTTHDIWTSLSSFVLDCTVTDCLISSNSTCQTHTHTLMPGPSLKQRSRDRGKFAWVWTASSPARSFYLLNRKCLKVSYSCSSCYRWKSPNKLLSESKHTSHDQAITGSQYFTWSFLNYPPCPSSWKWLTSGQFISTTIREAFVSKKCSFF